MTATDLNPVMTEQSDGTRVWYWHGKLHRTDGPAIEQSDGDRLWYHHGERHRTDGPALERADGYREWWLHGLLHRTDGPAVEWATGDCSWWLKGQQLEFANWLQQATNDPAERTLLALRWR